MNRSNEQDRVVAETNRLNRETSERLGRIERQLEHTTHVSTTIVKEKLHTSAARLEQVERDAEVLLASTKTAHKLLSRLRRWGASRHVGRHGRKNISSPKRKNHEENGLGSTFRNGSNNSRIEELFNELGVNTDVLSIRDEVQEQEASFRDMEQQIASSTAEAAAKNSETAGATCAFIRTSSNTTEQNVAEQDAALDRIENLLDGLHHQAKEYASILDSQKNGLDTIEDTMASAHTSLRMINSRLRT